MTMDRFTASPQDIDATRWPYVIPLPSRQVLLDEDGYDDVPPPEVLAWLAENAPQDGWRLSVNKIRGPLPDPPTFALSYLVVTSFVRQVHLTDVNAALAFKLRFG